jgi:hypothetical protein
MSSDDYPQEPSGVPGIEPYEDVNDSASGIVEHASSADAAATAAATLGSVPPGDPYAAAAGLAAGTGFEGEPGVTSVPAGSIGLPVDEDIPVTHVAPANPYAPFDPYAAAAAAAQSSWVPSSPIVDAAPAPQAPVAKAARAATKAGLVVRIICYVVVVVLAVGAVLWNNASKPITTAAFKRLASTLSNTETFGTFSTFNVANGIEDCAAFTTLTNQPRDGQEVEPGFGDEGNDTALLLLRFLENKDAVAFAKATYACLEQSEFLNLSETTYSAKSLFGVLGTVDTWETLSAEPDHELTIHAAVYRNVVAWNLDYDPMPSPVSFDAWNEWAAGPFKDAVNDSRNS